MWCFVYVEEVYLKTDHQKKISFEGWSIILPWDKHRYYIEDTALFWQFLDIVGQMQEQLQK